VISEEILDSSLSDIQGELTINIEYLALALEIESFEVDENRLGFSVEGCETFLYHLRIVIQPATCFASIEQSPAHLFVTHIDVHQKDH
jgi:hypothetical protein